MQGEASSSSDPRRANIRQNVDMVSSPLGWLPAPCLLATPSYPPVTSSLLVRQAPSWTPTSPPTPLDTRLCSSARAEPPAPHAPAPRRLDNAAMALLTRVPASADALEAVLVGVGVVAVAAAVALEFAATRARQLQVQHATAALPACTS